MFCEAVVNAVFVLLCSHKVSSIPCPIADTVSPSEELSRLAVKSYSTVVNGTGCFSEYFRDLSLFHFLNFLYFLILGLECVFLTSLRKFSIPLRWHDLLISLLGTALKCITPAELMAMCQKQQELRCCSQWARTEPSHNLCAVCSYWPVLQPPFSILKGFGWNNCPWLWLADNISLVGKEEGNMK